MMIAAVIGLGQLALAINRAAEFPAPDDQRVVEQAALLEIRSPERPKAGRRSAHCSARSRGRSLC